MRKLIGLVVAMGFMLQSCVTTEEVTVKKEGSITYSIDINFSELLKTVPNMNSTSGDVKKALDLVNGEELTIEQLLDLTVLESKNSEQMKDSILKANPDLLEKTKNIRLRIRMNDSIGNVAFKVIAKNAPELNTSLVNFDELTKIGESSGKKMEAPEFVRKSKFDWKKKSFQRSIDVKPEEVEKSLGDLGQMAAMFSYKMKVNFEQPIKSVSYSDALISQDGKSFVKEFKMSDIIANPKILEYKVELK